METDTIGLIPTKEVATSTEIESQGCETKVASETQDEQTECKQKASSMQDENRMKLDPKIQQTRGVKRKRTLVLQNLSWLK